MAATGSRPPLPLWQLLAAISQGTFFVAYPLVVYFAHTRLEARGVGGLLLGLYAVALVLRMRGSPADARHLLLQHAPIALVIAVAIALDDRTLLLLLPMLVSLYLLATFSWSLRHGPSMVERFARMVEDDLPPFTFSYCRRVTWIWCGFMLLNSIAVVVLALAAPLEWWALYTGLVFYLLMGVLIGGEFCFRKGWFRHYGDGSLDRLLARVLPAENTANGRRSLAYVAQREAGLTASTTGDAPVAGCSPADSP
jgi:uncharacterized membrane protein